MDEKNKNSFTAIGINIDVDMNIIVEAATFVKLSLCKKIKKINDYPKYVFSNKNCSLKRVFDVKTDEVYIKKGIYNKKAQVPFFTMNKGDLKNNKVYFLYYVLDLLKQKYNALINFSFNKINVVETIGVEQDKHFMEHALKIIKGMPINFVNLVSGAEFEDEFKSLCHKLQEKIGLREVSLEKKIDNDKANILLIHNKEYYEQLGYPDPYKNFKRSTLIQYVTIEDSADKIINDNEAIINTIIKEIVIKNDILNKKCISLDNWNKYEFDYDLVFGKEKNGRHYFILIHPNGSFELYNKSDDFSSFNIDILDKCSDCLTDNKGKEKIIIASTNGDINIITRTNRYTLPSKEFLNQEVLSRSKVAREKFLFGVVDINLFKEDNSSYYNVGIKGSGMNTKIIRAPHLYKIDVISGKNIMKDILSMLSAIFVKYKSFTVLPYPIKYLNEFILIMESEIV